MYWEMSTQEETNNDFIQNNKKESGNCIKPTLNLNTTLLESGKYHLYSLTLVFWAKYSNKVHTVIINAKSLRGILAYHARCFARGQALFDNKTRQLTELASSLTPIKMTYTSSLKRIGYGRQRIDFFTSN